jgi:hypothetical protein
MKSRTSLFGDAKELQQNRNERPITHRIRSRHVQAGTVVIWIETFKVTPINEARPFEYTHFVSQMDGIGGVLYRREIRVREDWACEDYVYRNSSGNLPAVPLTVTQTSGHLGEQNLPEYQSTLRGWASECPDHGTATDALCLSVAEESILSSLPGTTRRANDVHIPSISTTSSRGETRRTAFCSCLHPFAQVHGTGVKYRNDCDRGC